MKIVLFGVDNLISTVPADLRSSRVGSVRRRTDSDEPRGLRFAFMA